MVVISWSRVCCTNEAQWRQRLEHGEAIAALQHRVLVKIADAAAFEQSRFWRSTCYTNLNLIWIWKLSKTQRTVLPGPTVYRISLRYKPNTIKFGARWICSATNTRCQQKSTHSRFEESRSWRVTVFSLICQLHVTSQTWKQWNHGFQTRNHAADHGQWSVAVCIRSACEMKMQTLTIIE